MWLKKSLAVEVGERTKLVDLWVVHGGKFDALERADMAVTNLKKEVKGLLRDLWEVEDKSVTVLKLSHQKDLQYVQFKAKTVEIDLTVQRKLVATLKEGLKLAGIEASRAGGKLNNLVFHNAKSDYFIQTIQQKQTLR